MTQEEAEKLAIIFATADGGCISCCDGICAEANDHKLGWWFKLNTEKGDYPGTVEVHEGNATADYDDL